MDSLRYKSESSDNGKKQQQSKISVADVDKASRGLKDALDYFVVLTSESHNASGKGSSSDVVQSRVAAGLPGQVVHVGTLGKKKRNDLAERKIWIKQQKRRNRAKK